MDEVETIDQFLKAARLKLKVGRLYKSTRLEDHNIYHADAVFTRKADGKQLKLTTWDCDGLPVGTIEGIFDCIKLILCVKDSYTDFCGWRMRERIPLKEIGAEWRMYREPKLAMRAFFTTDEIECLKLDFYE